MGNKDVKALIQAEVTKLQREQEDAGIQKDRSTQDTARGIMGIVKQAIADKEAEKAAGKSTAPTSTALPDFQSIDSSNAAASVGRANTIGSKGGFLGEAAETEQTAPGPPSEGGLPPRTQDTTTTRTGGGSGLLGAIQMLSGKGRESTRSSPNPQFEQALQNRALADANTRHSFEKGLTSAEDYAAFRKEQRGPFKPEEQARFDAISSQHLQALKIQQDETDTNQALALTTKFAKDGVHDAGLSLQGARAETPEQVSAYGEAVAKAYKNSPDAIRADKIAEAQLTLAEINAKTAEQRYADGNKARAANLIEDEKKGAFFVNGSHPTLTEQQITEGQEGLWFKKTAGAQILDLDNSKLPAYSKYVEAEIALGGTVNFPLPERGFINPGDVSDIGDQDDPGHFKNNRGKIFQVDMNEAYRHVLTVTRLGFKANGDLAENDNEIDLQNTQGIRQESYKWLNLNGWDAAPDEFDQAVISFNPDFDYPDQITKMTNIFRTTIAGGDERKATITNLNDYRGSDVPAAKVAPEQLAPMTKAFATGILQAEQVEAQQARRKQAEEVRSRQPAQPRRPLF